MKHLTKFFYALAAIVLALASCTKMPSAGIVSNSDQEIRFDNAIRRMETKVFSETTDATLETEGFKIAAIIDADKSVMFNKDVFYCNGVWRTQGENHYFPVEGTMSFYGVYPTSQAISIDSGVATLSYSQNVDTDLIAAKVTAVSKTSDAVTMNFEHILSQVSIKVQGEDASVDYKVFSVTITDADGGIYAYEDGNWTPNPTTVDYSVYNNAEGMAVSTSEMTAIGSPMSFMPGIVKLNVVWKCFDKESKIILEEKNAAVDVILDKGKNTILNLTLPFNESSSKLLYTRSVGVWVSDSQDIMVKESYVPLAPGVFTVNSTGKKVKFSSGYMIVSSKNDVVQFSNKSTQLLHNAAIIRIDDHYNQSFYSGLFHWSKTASVAYAINYDNSGCTTTDTFFAADSGAIEGYTVLTKDEWQYLIDKALAKNSSLTNKIIIDGENYAVLKPDGFCGTVADTYSLVEWTIAENTYGFVALPFAGYGSGSSGLYDIGMRGSVGSFWSSTPDIDNIDKAWCVYFDDENAKVISGFRKGGKQIRLVQVVE